MTYYEYIVGSLNEIKFLCNTCIECKFCPLSKGEQFKYCRIAGSPQDWDIKDMEAQNGKDKIH